MKLLTSKEAAHMLGTTEATLRTWRWAKVGPPYIKMSRGAIRYRPDAIEQYLERCTVNHVEAQGGKYE